MREFVLCDYQGFVHSVRIQIESHLGIDLFLRFQSFLAKIQHIQYKMYTPQSGQDIGGSLEPIKRDIIQIILNLSQVIKPPQETQTMYNHLGIEHVPRVESNLR